MPTIRVAAVLCCFLVCSVSLAAAATDSCILGPQPAASLLVPYFEIDLDQPEGRTTLLAIVNTSSEEPAIARLVLWTDWGIPTLALDLLLSRDDIQTINLRDVFSGKLGESASLELIEPEALTTAALAELAAKHTGIANPADGLCYGRPREDTSLAIGYATVDLLERSSTSIAFQTEPGYFEGGDPLASTDNRLTGDFFFVDSEEAFAQGFEAVHLVAQPERFAQQSGPSFYSAFVGSSGADARLPLSTHHRARFFVGSPAVAGTDLIVWLDNGVAGPPQQCGEGPPWFAFGIPDLEIDGVDEEENAFDTAVEDSPVRTQTLRIGVDVPVPAVAGALDVRTRVVDAIGAPPSFVPVQGWVAPMVSAFGQFSVGWNATRLDDGCITLAD